MNEELSPEKINKLMVDVFGFTSYDSESNKLFPFDPMTGESVSEEKKFFFDIIKNALETETGKKIFSQIDENQPVNLIEKKKKKGSYGYRSNHLIAFCIPGLESPKSEQIATFLHELTHEVQSQKAGAMN